MDPLLVLVAAVAAALLVAALVLLVLWLHARRSARIALAERTRAERARIRAELALAEQTSRIRMVRELHELAAHGMTALVSRAEGARYAATRDPDVAARTAGAIEDAARATLADLRRAARVARDGEVAAGPLPDLTVMEELVGTLRDAGLEVELSESGERPELPSGVELALLGILQEALGNALAHGGPGTRAEARLSWTDDGVRLVVEDDGIRATAIRKGLDPALEAQRQGYTAGDDLAALTEAPAGRGMTEMRERTELFGGVFTARRVPGVGFTVQAVFPSLRRAGAPGVRLDAD